MRYKKFLLVLTIASSCLLGTFTLASEIPPQQSTPHGMINDSFENFFLENKVKAVVPIMSFAQRMIPHLPKTMDLTIGEDKPSFIEEYTNLSHDILKKGIEYLGVRYRLGGSSENTGFDCSGFVRKVYENSIGLILPRTAFEMSEIGEEVSNLNNLKPGDLIFFNTMKRKFSHVGIYLGENKFMHSPRKGTKVRIEKLDKKYWMPRFNGGRRLLSSESPNDLSARHINAQK